MNRQFQMPILAGIALLIFTLSACTATPVKPGGFQEEYDKPLQVVKQAGIDAMSVHGFEVTQSTDVYIEGHRPRILAFSCIERAGIWLEQTSPSHTRVAVDSERSTFGTACREDWAELILSEMSRILGQRK
jgi:hypothetical protein